tara:strand:+ start:1453 stop:2613 length:1161 start_codon:yes stop_codon:yes gene_type:complete
MLKLTANWHGSITEIKENDWNNLSIGSTLPFYKWEWLEKLESSGSVAKSTGWQPFHLSVSREGKVIGIAPLYIKGHSFGEFIFDNRFHELSQQIGLNYYPKLIGMSPYSPIEGYKFLISSQENEREITFIMLEIIDKFAIQNNILSCNFLYAENEWSKIVQEYGYQKWLNCQSLWLARSTKDFSDYLQSFNSNQRRNIKRERKSISESGIKIKSMSGEDINSNLMLKMHEFYSNHCLKWGPWGSKYLTKSFFEKIASEKHKIVLFGAYREDPNNPIAMSMCITDEKMLWGRYWGSQENIEYLHFELCYYTPIAWALKKGLRSFDPGAGGSHKLRRGFQAKSNQSLHRWYNKTMHDLIRSWLPKANQFMEEEINRINNELPFRTTSS